MTKKEYHEQKVNDLLINQLNNLKKAEKEIEGLINAELLDVNSKVIRVLEVMQAIKFDTYILRELDDMNDSKE